MNGHVDDALRALLRVPVSASRDGERTDLVVWVDTAFNGGLVIPKMIIANLDLLPHSLTEAILADGQLVALEAYTCFYDWFGNTYETQIVASEAELALLGTMMLDGHHLEIDYATRTLQLN